MTLFLLGIVFLLVILHWATRGASPSNLGQHGGGNVASATGMANVCLCMSNRMAAVLVAVITMILAVAQILASFAEHALRAGTDQPTYLLVVELNAVLRAWSVTSYIDFLAALMLIYGVLNKHMNSLTMWIVFKVFLLSMSAVSTLYASFHQHSMSTMHGDGNSSGYSRYRSDHVSSEGYNSSQASYSTLPYNQAQERRDNPLGVPFALATALLFPLQILCVYVVHKYRNELLCQELLRSLHVGGTSGGRAGSRSSNGEDTVEGGVPVSVQNFRFIPPGLNMFSYNTDDTISVPPRNDFPPAYDEVAKVDKLPTYLEAVLNTSSTGTSSSSVGGAATSVASQSTTISVQQPRSITADVVVSVTTVNEDGHATALLPPPAAAATSSTLPTNV